MNKKQKTVVTAAVVLVIACGLFPPYEGEYRGYGHLRKTYAGYHCIFFPPSIEQLQAAFGTWSSSRYLFNARIIVSQVCLQVGILVIAAAGLYLLFGDRKTGSPSTRDD